ncbi:MAG: DUF4349 domain-containing protein [Eubacteriales bacterium]
MKCREVKDQLSPYLDGALEQAAMREIINHLEACHDCLEDFRALGVAVNALRSLPPLKLPPGFCETVLKRVPNKRSKRKRAVRPLFGTVAMAAAIFLVVGVTALFYGNPMQWVTKTNSQKSFLGGKTAGTDGGGRPGSIPGDGDRGSDLAGKGQADNTGTDLVKSGVTADLSGGPGAARTAAPVTSAPTPGAAGKTGGGSGDIQIAAQQGTVPDRTEAVSNGTALLAALPSGSQRIASREFTVSRQVSYGSLQVSQQERPKVILGATLSVSADPAGFSGEAAAIAQSNGGIVLTGGEGEGRTAVLVPAGHFDQALNSLRRLSQVNLISVSRDDVTEKYLNIESGIRNLSNEEQSLIASCIHAETEEERVAAQSKLSAVRLALDQEKKSFDDLAGKVEYATLFIVFNK